MFEVLVFVYENYWRGEACPELQQLGRKLSAHGFDAEEISAALVWLDGLTIAAQSAAQSAGTGLEESPISFLPQQQSAWSMRVYSASEQAHLGAQGLGFVMFLESAGVLPAAMREIVIDRAMAVNAEPMTVDELKIIVLMVYWSFGQEPDALVLDELCDSAEGRLAH